MGRASGAWIDPERCHSLAIRWVDAGNEWFRQRFEVAGSTARLDLDDAAVDVLGILARASEELWVTAGALDLAARRATEADTMAVAEWPQLRRLAGAHPTSVSSWPDVIAAWRQSSPGGDPGETFDADPRPPVTIGYSAATSHADRARALVVRAITHTGDAGQIGPDEFELVRLGDRQYLVVLPGVTDLTHPHLGLDPRHRTVRDLDRFAVRSARSTSVAHNHYARMVWDGMIAANAPIGSEVIIVGHSFGADTALDLAADPRFNGAAGYAVTHVVAAGYDSIPQLGSVPERTAVLVVQNADDLVVIAESSVGWVVRDGPWTGAAIRHTPGLPLDGDGRLLEPGVHDAGSRQVVDVFAGGRRGAGHHPAVYADHLAQQRDPSVVGFLASMGARLTAGIASSLAIDVSVPDDR